MTISQALRRINKLKHEAKEHFERAQNAVMFEASSPPAFTFSTSHELALQTIEEIVKLETQLRVTNATTSIDWAGRKITLAEATARLQQLKGRIAWTRALTVQAQEERTDKTQSRSLYNAEMTITERVFKCALPEAKRAEWVKKIQDEFDTLNDTVEAANHRTALVG